MGRRRRRLHAVAAGAAALASLLIGARAGAIDWNAVPARDVEVFHTGQAGWEWMLTTRDHSGGKKMREGKTCQDCHADEERKIGELIASGEKVEPHPEKVRNAATTVQVKFAHDADRLYVRFEWPVSKAGASKSRIALMLANASVKEARLGGCWATCHADLPAMQHGTADTERTKYLVQSRNRITRTGGGDDVKPPAALRQLLEQGNFIVLWATRLERGAPAVASDGYVLEKRHENEAPAVRARGEQRDGRWIAELSRSLAAGGPGHPALVPGETYTVGISLHEGDDEGRFHLVSLEYTLRLDEGPADFVARRK